MGQVIYTGTEGAYITTAIYPPCTDLTGFSYAIRGSSGGTVSLDFYWIAIGY